MSKLQDKCRAVKIYNDYEFFGADQPWIDWMQNGGRTVRPPMWIIYKRNCNPTELDPHVFTDVSYSGGLIHKKQAFLDAQDAMTHHFGIKEFARSPFGGWGDAEFVKRRLKEIDEMYKALVKE